MCQPPAQRLPLLADRLLQVDDHHDSGLDRRPEQRNEADPDRDRKVVPEEVLEIDPTGQREGDGQKDLCGVQKRPVGEVEQDEDHGQDDRNHDLEALAGPDFVLVLAAPLDVRPLGEPHALPDNAPCLLDEAPDVPAAHVEEHGDYEEAVLA